MKQKTALNIILYISLVGVLFSGTLSFFELAMSSCPLGGCSSLAGIPVCVYGLIMYIAIFVVALIGRK